MVTVEILANDEDGTDILIASRHMVCVGNYAVPPNSGMTTRDGDPMVVNYEPSLGFHITVNAAKDKNND